ncbi:MAG: AAA family ATPase [Candidatus Pacebacteria bacterium]|nr:AAA family ATPase [Candidatus Paceibacterota bacterium]
MDVKVFAANREQALAKISEGHIKGVALRDDSKYLIEYIPSSTSKKDIVSSQIIIFEHNGDQIKCWHHCAASASDYKYGCWHLGLAGWLFKLPGKEYHVTIEGIPDLATAQTDISSTYGIASQFRKVKVASIASIDPIIEVVDTSGKKYNLLDKYYLPESLLEKVLAFRERQEARLTDEQKSRIPKANYITQGRELISAISPLMYKTWAPPLFMGPAGSGKSTMAEACAEILNLPLCRISGGIDLNAAYLLGEKTLSPTESANEILTAKVAVACAKAGTSLASEEVHFVADKLKESNMKVVHEPGILLKAVQNGEMILVDEVNMMIPEVTSLLHSLLDWQRSITVPGIGEVKAHPDFRFVSAMNVGYMGTRPLNKAFRDRFRGVQISGITRGTLIELLEEYTDNETAQKLASVYETIYESVYSPTGATLSESCISLRALLRAAEEYSMEVGFLREITVSCLTESIESESERTQLKDLIESRIKK